MNPTAVIQHNEDGNRLPFLYMPMEYQDNVDLADINIANNNFNNNVSVIEP